MIRGGSWWFVVVQCISQGYSMGYLAYLVVDIVLSWSMSWFKQEMLCQS